MPPREQVRFVQAKGGLVNPHTRGVSPHISRRVTVNLTEDLWRMISAEATRDKRAVSAVVRDRLTMAYLKQLLEAA